MRSNQALNIAGGCLWIYFVRGGGLVKIGQTTGVPTRRFKSLQAQSPVPLDLTAVSPGTEDSERKLHRLFSQHRHHYEWFDEVPKISSVIEDSRRRYGPPDPGLGVPEYLLAIADADLSDDEDERQVQAHRLAEWKQLHREVHGYLKFNRQIPADLEGRYFKAGALIGSLRREYAA